jgi:hypothetical protein
MTHKQRQSHELPPDGEVIRKSVEETYAELERLEVMTDAEIMAEFYHKQGAVTRETINVLMMKGKLLQLFNYYDHEDDRHALLKHASEYIATHAVMSRLYRRYISPSQLQADFRSVVDTALHILNLVDTDDVDGIRSVADDLRAYANSCLRRVSLVEPEPNPKPATT